MTLAFAPIGKQVKVVEIKAEDKTKKHLESIGLGAGSFLTAVSDSGGSLKRLPLSKSAPRAF